MFHALAEVVEAIAAGEARSRHPEDRALAKQYLAALAPVLAGAVAGKDIASELVTFERLLGHTWLIDEEPFRTALSMWRALLQASRQASGAPADEASAHFLGVLRLLQRLKALPAECFEHTYSREAFGSWALTLRHKGEAFRVVCDGRERELIVERSASRKPPYGWERAVHLEFAASQTLGPEILEAVARAAG
jgi:hypothetical protein